MSLAFPKSTSAFMYSIIYQNILKRETDRLGRIGEDLGKRNEALGGSPSISYRTDILYVKGGHPIKQVLPALSQEAAEHAQLINKYTKDREYIRLALNIIVPEYNELPAIRNVLPELIVGYIPELRHFKRTKEPLYTIEGNKSKLESWNKANDLIEYYIGNMLVYT